MTLYGPPRESSPELQVVPFLAGLVTLAHLMDNLLMNRHLPTAKAATCGSLYRSRGQLLGPRAGLISPIREGRRSTRGVRAVAVLRLMPPTHLCHQPCTRVLKHQLGLSGRSHGPSSAMHAKHARRKGRARRAHLVTQALREWIRSMSLQWPRLMSMVDECNLQLHS